MGAKDFSEVIRNYFQIVAIFVAAAWTIYVFYGKEAPLLESRTNITNRLDIEAGLLPSTCGALFNVTLENVGVRAFDVEKVRIRAWGLDPAKIATSYYDFTTELTSGSVITDEVYDGTKRAGDLPEPLVGHYPAGTGRHHTFLWELPKEPPRILYARVDIFQSKNENRASWYVVQIERIKCDRAANS
jgi:hypothetical protein